MQNFNFHQHTYRCKHADTDYTDEDYVLESIANNLKAICFTDHAPSSVDKRTRMRMNIDEKEEYIEKISSLKAKYNKNIEIYTGFEVEYTELTKNEIIDLKKEVDMLILGQHFILENNKPKIINYSKYTDDDLDIYINNIENALKLGIISIIAHPDFVMLARKEFGEKEKEMAKRICLLAEKYNVPLEINLNRIFAKTYFDYENKRLNNYKEKEEYIKDLKNIEYPSKEFWNIAKDYNIKVLYGLDVHFKGQITLFEELKYLANQLIGEETINKLNFCTKDDIINKIKKEAKEKQRKRI